MHTDAQMLQASLHSVSLPRQERRVTDQMSETGGPRLLGRIVAERQEARLFQRQPVS